MQANVELGRAGAVIAVWDDGGVPVMLVSRWPTPGQMWQGAQFLAPGRDPVDVDTGHEVSIPLSGCAGWMLCFVQHPGDHGRLWRRHVAREDSELSSPLSVMLPAMIDASGTVRAAVYGSADEEFVWPVGESMRRVPLSGPITIPWEPVVSACGRWRAGLELHESGHVAWVAPV